jgi:hypothetical protein
MDKKLGKKYLIYYSTMHVIMVITLIILIK